MSMDVWTENGYGYELCPDADGFEKVKEFILKHRELLLKQGWNDDNLEALRNAEDKMDYYFAMDEYPSSTIAFIINSLEGTKIFRGYEPDDYQPEMLGAEPLYPWQLNPCDKMLKEEDIKRILKQYGKEFGNEREPERFIATYFG